MFGADVAQLSMLNAGRASDTGGTDKLDYLLPNFHQQLPWIHDQKSPVEDFILIAEFSEQEGPRPVIVIPEGGGKHFDQNEFSVKILAVDHQSSIVEGCHMTEDAQVVMSDSDQGAHAFIHHIVLNDIQARGYVRPFCMTYVTTDSMKIMKCYERLSTQLKEVARLMKFGNRLVFMRDLEKRLEDLDYTKTQLLISQSRVQSSSQGDGELLNTLNTIRQSMEEVKDILASLKQQLMDKELEDRFQVYERELKASQQQTGDGTEMSSLKDCNSSGYSGDGDLSGSNSCSSEFSLFNKSKDLKPKLLDVSTIGGKRRFDRSLRGLQELCSWGAKEGLQKLRIIRQGLKRDLSSIMLEDFDFGIMAPPTGVLSFGHNSIGANFLSACNSSRDACCLTRKIHGMDVQFNHLSSMGSVDSFKSLPSSYQSLDEDTMYSVSSSLVGSVYDRQNSDPGFDEYGVTFGAIDELVDEMRVELESTVGNSMTRTLTGDSLNQASQDNVDHHSCSDSSEYDSISIDKDLKCVARGCSCEETNKKDNDTHANVDCVDTGGDNVCDSEEGRVRSPMGNGAIEQTVCECRKDDKKIKDLGNVFKKGVNDGTNSSDEWKDKMSSLKTRHASEIFESVNAFEDELVAIETEIETRCFGLTDSTSTLTDPNVVNFEKTLVENAEDEKKGLYDEERDDLETPQPDILLDTNCDETTVINKYEEPEKHSSSANIQNDSQTTAKTDVKLDNLDENLGMVNKDIRRFSEGIVDTWTKSMPEVDDTWRGDAHRHSISSSSVDGQDNSDLRLMYSKDSMNALSRNIDNESLKSSSEATRSFARKKVKWSPHSFTTEVDEVTVNCVHKVLTSYNNLQHVVYSLLARKPVVVIATQRHEAVLKELVKALGMFTPMVPGGAAVGLVCQLKQLKITEVRKFQLRGLIRHDRRAVDFLIPSSVRRYLTLVDLDKMLICCQPYQGPLLNFVSAIYNKRISFKTDQAFFRYIQMHLIEISTKAFTFYHSITSADKDMDFSGATLPRKSFMLEMSAEKYLSQSGHVTSDWRIIKHLSEVVKIQQLDEEFRAKFLTDAPVHPFGVAYQSVQTYRM